MAGERNVPQVVGQIPWGHVRSLLDKVKDSGIRLWYADRAVAEGWSRTVAMLSSVLRSEQAIAVNIAIMRASQLERETDAERPIR